MHVKPSITIDRPDSAALAENPQLATAWGTIDQLLDQLDLQADEFHRIRVATDNQEVAGLCDRALLDIQRRVPVLLELEETKAALHNAKLDNEALKKQLNNQ
ncbi:MAG: hypothetical protein GY833_22010 [Aestuariibacter sp.]|nr:hypothetical protein [Aestuariibacter sp.]